MHIFYLFSEWGLPVVKVFPFWGIEEKFSEEETDYKFSNEKQIKWLKSGKWLEIM